MRCVIKHMRFHPLDRDLTVRMLPARLNHDHYNALFKPRVFDEIRWTTSPCDPRTPIDALFDPTLSLQPRVLHLENCVGLSLTRKKLRGSIGFIICDGLEG